MSSWKCLLCFYVILINNGILCEKTVYLEDYTPTLEEFEFMRRYGYLDEQGDHEQDYAYTPQSISEGLMKMQAYAGLPSTGTMNPDTKKLFTKKRCGVKDIMSTSEVRSKREAGAHGWKKRDISYRVLGGVDTMPKYRVEELTAKALDMWAVYANLNFTRVDDDSADIPISFVRKDHGDGFPFDGPGRVVAHAFQPPHGAVHFDADEYWTEIESPKEDDGNVTDFFASAVHELGHSLGLLHSESKESVMYAYYQAPLTSLSAEDIMRLQKLYLIGELTAEPVTQSIETPPPVAGSTKASEDELEENYIPDLCMTNYDTLQVIHGKIYVFEEEWVWVFRERNELEDGYPKRFHEVFHGLPAHFTTIRTIYERRNGHVVIFKGRNYWEFSTSFKFIKRGRINEYNLPPRLRELTTVFISNFNNKTYLINEDWFWRYDEITHSMDNGYPKEMSAWRQIPYPVDAAIIWRGDTFFFQGPRFWRFDNKKIAAHAYYPMPVAQVWFSCGPTPEMNSYTVNVRP